MNDGVNTTPEQAARSLRVVRLVSFLASAALALIVLAGIATLRYAAQWTTPEPARVAVAEIVQAPTAAPTHRPIQRPPSQPRTDAPPQVTPTPAPDVAPAAPSDPVVVTDPVWVERPRNPERFYPREAFMQGVAGEAVLDCDVDVSGRLTCVVVSETPEGRGFGEAALRIARAHVMRPATRNGAPTTGRYRMVVPFSPSS